MKKLKNLWSSLTPNTKAIVCTASIVLLIVLFLILLVTFPEIGVKIFFIVFTVFPTLLLILAIYYLFLNHFN